MPKTIVAIASIIEWDGELSRMAVLNPGDEAEVGDKLAEVMFEAGKAKPAGAKKAGKAKPAGEVQTEDAQPVGEAASDEAPV